jgi:hypothetical protein
MVGSKVQSWRQKKKLLKLLQDKADEFKSLEAKLIKGEVLNPLEQQIYDSNSGADAEKIAWLQGDCDYNMILL